MKVRTALIIASLAATTSSFASSVYHASPVQEEGAGFAPDPGQHGEPRDCAEHRAGRPEGRLTAMDQSRLSSDLSTGQSTDLDEDT